MKGWIKLHRCIQENHFYFEERFTKGQAWIDLLLLAAHKQQTVYIKGQEINLLPGELCWSQKSLAERWKWNRKTVMHFLADLVVLSMADIRKNSVTTIISLKNWTFYQCTNEEGDTSTDSQADTGTDTNKNVKNIRSINSKHPKNFSRNKTGGVLSGKDGSENLYSVRSRLTYKPDPAKSRDRYEKIQRLFGN